MRLYSDASVPVKAVTNFCGMNVSEAEDIIRKCGSGKVFDWIHQLKNKPRAERQDALVKRAGINGYDSFTDLLTSERFLDGVEAQRRSEIKRAVICAFAIVEYLHNGKQDSSALKRTLIMTRMGAHIRLKDVDSWPMDVELHEIKRYLRGQLEAHWRRLYQHLTADACHPRPQVIPGAVPNYLHGSPKARALLADTGVRTTTTAGRA